MVFYGDFDGSFHMSLDLMIDLSALLGPQPHRWSAYVSDGKVKAFNLEEVYLSDYYSIYRAAS